MTFIIPHNIQNCYETKTVVPITLLNSREDLRFRNAKSKHYATIYWIYQGPEDSNAIDGNWACCLWRGINSAPPSSSTKLYHNAYIEIPSKSAKWASCKSHYYMDLSFSENLRPHFLQKIKAPEFTEVIVSYDHECFYYRYMAVHYHWGTTTVHWLLRVHSWDMVACTIPLLWRQIYMILRLHLFSKVMESFDHVERLIQVFVNESGEYLNTYSIQQTIYIFMSSDLCTGFLIHFLNKIEIRWFPDSISP